MGINVSDILIPKQMHTDNILEIFSKEDKIKPKYVRRPSNYRVILEKNGRETPIGQILQKQREQKKK